MPDYKQYFCVDHGYLEYGGPYPDNVQEALDISIAKWEFLVENPVWDGADGTCGLCMLFLRLGDLGDPPHCEGCPIANAGYVGCRGTAYETYLNADICGTKDEMIAAAKQQVDFLKSLQEQYK